MKRKGLVGEIKIDSYLPFLIFSVSSHCSCSMKFVHLPHCTFYLFIQFFSTRSVVHFLSLTRSFVNEHHEYILPHPTCRRFSFVFSFISFSFCSAYFIVSFALFYIFIVILFAFPSLSFCLVLSLHFCIFIFISPVIFLLLRVCSSN